MVYDCFKGIGSKPIDSRATRFDPLTEKYEAVKYNLGSEDSELLKNVFDAYGHLNAFRLSNISHERGSPWDRVWNAPKDKITLGMKIPDVLIREHFRSRHWGSVH